MDESRCALLQCLCKVQSCTSKAQLPDAVPFAHSAVVLNVGQDVPARLSSCHISTDCMEAAALRPGVAMRLQYRLKMSVQSMSAWLGPGQLEPLAEQRCNIKSSHKVCGSSPEEATAFPHAHQHDGLP